MTETAAERPARRPLILAPIEADRPAGRRPPATATRSRIKEAFLRLLDEKSFFDLTVANVLAEAKVSRGTFYFHYATLSELVAELGHAAMTRLIADIASSVNTLGDAGASDSGDSRAWIEKVLSVGVKFSRENPSLLRAILEAERADDSLREVWQRQQSAIDEVVLTLVAADPEAVEWLDGHDTVAVVAAMTQLNERLLYLSACGVPPFDDEDTLATTLTDIWTLSLYGRRD